jgi:hypothetical protein
MKAHQDKNLTGFMLQLSGARRAASRICNTETMDAGRVTLFPFWRMSVVVSDGNSMLLKND